MKARLNRPHLALAIDGPENVERQEDVATPVLKKSNSFDERRTSFVRVARKVSQQKQIALSSLPAQGSLAEQIAVRIIEQRYKSHLSVVPRDFTLAGGDEPAEWGTLQFVGVKESSVASKPRQAQYVRLAHDSSPVRITRILTKFWKIDRPSFIISIIGGASADLRKSLKPRLQTAFTRGLVTSARTARALLVTRGTACGVNELLGEALEQASEHVPLIGFAAWSKVNNREALKGNRGEKDARNYVPLADGDGVAIEPHHSHFMFVDTVDSGKTNACGGWGGEVALRDGVLDNYMRMYSVPGLLLVVQGGAHALSMVVHALVTSQSPIVLLSDSGGLAALLAACAAAWDGSEAPPDLSTFDDGVHPAGYWAKHAKPIAEIEASRFGEVVEGQDPQGHQSLLVPYRLQEHSTEDVDAAILRAIIRKQEAAAAARRQGGASGLLSPSLGLGRTPSVRRGLPVARQMSSATPELAKRRSSCSAIRDDKARAKSSAVDRSLRLAVQWNRLEIVSELLKRRQSEHSLAGGAGAHGSRAWSHREGSTSTEAVSAASQGALQLALEQEKPQMVDLLLAHKASLARVSILSLYSLGPGSLGALVGDKLKPIAEQKWKRDAKTIEQRREKEEQTYGETVAPFIDNLIPGYAKAYRSRYAGHKLRGSDVFVWAVLSGSWELAQTLWRHTKNPVRTGLFAARLLRELMKKMEHVAIHSEQLTAQAEAFERHASGVLDELPQETAVDGLLAVAMGGWDESIIQFAWDGDLKSFLFHPHCLKLVARNNYQTDKLALPANSGQTMWIYVIKNSLWPFRLKQCTDLQEQEERERLAKEYKSRRSRRSLLHAELEKVPRLGRFEKAVEFYNIPFVKEVVRNFVFVLYLCVFVAALLLRVELGFPDEVGPQLFLEVAFGWWTVSMAIDEMYQFSNDPKHFSSFSNKVDLVWLLALHLSLGLSWFDYTLGDFLRPLLVGMDEDESWDEIADGHVELGAGRAPRPGGGGGAQATGNTHRFEVFSLASLQRTPQRAALLLLGVGAVPLFLRVLNVFSNHQKLGILMIILRKMIYDVVLFGVIAIIIAVGFGLAFVVVIRTQSDEWVHVWEERGEEEWDLKRVLQMPFWAMVGENSYDFMARPRRTLGRRCSGSTSLSRRSSSSICSSR